MRNSQDDDKRWAHSILDAVRNGLDVTEGQITRALWLLGDLV
jgi:hypothetical protein